MKEIKQCYDEILNLEKEILNLINQLNLVAKEGYSVKNKFRVLKPKTEDESDNNVEHQLTDIFTLTISSNNKHWDYNTKLNSNDFLIMYDALLKSKQKRYTHLKKEFKKLTNKIT